MVSRAEAAAQAAGNPLSFLHVVRSDIDLPPETDPHDPRVYAKARENLQYLMSEGFLVQEFAPGVFVYELTSGRRRQTGVVGCVHVDDYARNLIRKHETTRRDKEDDRTQHILTLEAHAEPVLLAHEASPFLAQLCKSVKDGDPLLECSADEVEHRVWRVEKPASFVDAVRRIPHAYIADGHHRCAGAWRAAQELRAKRGPDAADEADWFLAVLFPANRLRIQGYHRVVRDLNGMTPDGFIARLGEIGSVSATDTPLPQSAGQFGVYVDGRWYRFSLKAEEPEPLDPARSLDAALLQARVLEPVLAIGDVRTDARIGFVGGGRGVPELERLVNSGEMAAAFALRPVTMQQLMQVSDAGGIMPPKSTWFEPKLRSGLFVHSLR